MKKPTSVKLTSVKGVINAVMKYRKLRAAGKIGRSETMENASKFVTRKGTIKKRETRYNTGKQALNEAFERVKSETGSKTPSEKRIKDLANKERFEKAQKTYVDNNIKDKRFKKQAREKAEKYTKMVDIFASDTYNSLRTGEYGLGSDVVEALAERGLNEDDIINYLKQVKDSFDNIPNEARHYTEQSDFWNTVVNLSDSLIGEKDFNVADVINAYITGDGDREYFNRALENYISIGKKSLSFTDAWNIVSQTQDPASFDNMSEILDETASNPLLEKFPKKHRGFIKDVYKENGRYSVVVKFEDGFTRSIGGWNLAEVKDYVKEIIERDRNTQY